MFFVIHRVTPSANANDAGNIGDVSRGFVEPPLLTLEEKKNNYRNTVYLPSNSFSPGPHSWPYLHPALTQYAYPMSALRPGLWLAWISTLVSEVGVTAAV